MSVFAVRTDLALEEGERIRESGVEIHGVILEEETRPETGILVTRVKIETKNGAKIMGKPIGTYVTLEAGQLGNDEEEYQQEVAKELSMQLQKLIPDLETEKSVLVVGLGNPEATPDALGPKVLEHLQATRHLEMEYGTDFCWKHGYPILSGITPGVMAQTGMETAEIVKGIVQETEPDAVIVVDALAARSAGRLGVTVQLSDTGIQPGSGVGNHRSGLTEETLGIPVFAIGIPMVVGAAAIVYDTVGAMTEMLRERVECGSGDEEKGTKKEKTKKEAIKTEETEEDKETRKNGGKWTKEEPRRREEKRMIPEMLRVEEAFELVKELLKPDLGPMYVTPHDIDERVDFLSYTISEAIHGALFYNK